VNGRLTAIVLGSAAGGGVPQWNCACPVCRLARAGDPRVPPRTQTSLAVSGDGEHWILLNAAPDLRAQIAATPALHPRNGLRDSPIAAVVLTGAEIDQTAGLLTLRERQPFVLNGTAETLSTLAANPMFNALAADLVTRRTIAPDAAVALPGGISADLFPAPGKVPLYLEQGTPDFAHEDGTNVGIELIADDRRLVYLPGVAAMTPAIETRLARADVVLFDGTLFINDEMLVTGTGAKTGRRMGHMPIEGPNGSLAALSGLRARRIYVHINNTNPILVGGSPERRKVEASGWEVAQDGLTITL
jgi:pyrroloquinoline quinone biosynthesis protein B